MPVTLCQGCDVASAPGAGVHTSRAEAGLFFRQLRRELRITPEILAGDEILAAAKHGEAPSPAPGSQDVLSSG